MKRYKVIQSAGQATLFWTDSESEAIELCKQERFRTYVWDYAAKMVIWRNWEYNAEKVERE